MTPNNTFGRRRFNPPDEPAIEIATSAPARTSVVKLLGLVLCCALLGVGTVYLFNKYEDTLSAAMVIAKVLPQMEEVADEDKSKPDKIRSTGKLRGRSSFKTPQDFQKSESFKTAVIAGKAMPLAIYCKDRPALIAVRVVITAVAERNFYGIEQLARQRLKRKPQEFGYTQSDCTTKLPKLIAKIRARI